MLSSWLSGVHHVCILTLHSQPHRGLSATACLPGCWGIITFSLALLTRIGSLTCACSAGVVKMTWLVDFVGYSLRTAPPVRTQIQTTQMLQNHYPERLGLAVCYHAPRLFSLAYNVSPSMEAVPCRVSTAGSELCFAAWEAMCSRGLQRTARQLCGLCDLLASSVFTLLPST